MNKKKLANNIIKNHMYMAVGAGLIPVPIVDFVTVSGIQLDMLKKLTEVYDQDFEKNQAKVIISALGGAAVARIAAMFTKSVPVVGSILGGVTMSVLSGASTYALGEVFKYHFAKGGSIDDLDADDFKDFYKEKFEQGKAMAEKMEKENDAKVMFEEAIVDTEFNSKPQAPAQDDIIKKLRDFAQLKADGIITEEEFNKMKKDLIG